jgi:uncharacterized protein YbcI
MITPNATMAQQIAQAALASQHKSTGHRAKSVTVVLTDNTLVITLHGALSEAERVVAKDPAGAARVQEFHKELFVSSSDWLRQEINRITGVMVREATAEVETSSGTVVQAFTTGTVVQVFLLARDVPTDSWSSPAHGTPLV